MSKPPTQDAERQAARLKRIRRGNQVFAWGMLVLAAFLLVSSISGLVGTYRVAAAFRSAAPVVQWSGVTDLSAFLAPDLAALVGYVTGLTRWSSRRPILSFIALTVVFGIAISQGVDTLLEHEAASNQYQPCNALNVIDPHGNRGGGPAITSWGYGRGGCPAD